MHNSRVAKYHFHLPLFFHISEAKLDKRQSDEKFTSLAKKMRAARCEQKDLFATKREKKGWKSKAEKEYLHPPPVAKRLLFREK